MPLEYDDIPGSWGVYSRHWPTFHCRDRAHARRVFVACTKEKVVPYASYVMDGLELRVETEEMLARLKTHMAQTKVDDSDEIIRMYENIELPLHCYDESGIDMSQYLRKESWEKLKALREERQRLKETS